MEINLGGEGEIPGVQNQQPPDSLAPNWFSTTKSNPRKTIRELADEGHAFLICANNRLPFPDESVDVVYANSIPLDVVTHRGPGVQSSEIWRILKPGGLLIIDYGSTITQKP